MDAHANRMGTSSAVRGQLSRRLERCSTMKIDQHVFHAKFPHHCVLDRCKSRCCRQGVWADIEERDVILRHADLFLPYLRPEARNRSLWFGETAADPDG